MIGIVRLRFLTRNHGLDERLILDKAVGHVGSNVQGDEREQAKEEHITMPAGDRLGRILVDQPVKRPADKAVIVDSEQSQRRLHKECRKERKNHVRAQRIVTKITRTTLRPELSCIGDRGAWRSDKCREAGCR